MSALELVRSSLARGDQHLGDIAWWSLSDVRIDRTRLESIWTGAGLDPLLLPEPTKAERALKTAARQAQLGRPDLLVRLGKDEEKEVVFAIVRERRLADGSLEYFQEARVVLDRISATLSSDAPGHDVVRAIRSEYLELLHTHTADDVRRAVMRVLERCAAVTLREHGGVYWVPQPFAAELRRLQRAIEQIGSSRVQLLPVHRSAEAENTLGEIAMGAIELELSSLKAEIDGFLASPPDRPSTLSRRFDTFESIRARAGLYRQVLRVEIDDLDERLSEMAKAVEGLLHQKAAA